MFNRQIAAFAVALALLLAACTPAPKGGAATQSASGAEQPQAGGTLTFIVNAVPPSFDGHRETTFALLHPVAPFYSTLYKFDPSDLTKVMPDVAAAMPEFSADKLSATIKLRTDVKIHDGTKMTSDDIAKDKNGVQLPYLDGYKALIITDANAEVNAIRSKQAAIEFRGFTPQQRDTLSSALGTSLAIQEAPWICVNYVVPNTKKAPFDDVRVRQALTLAIDRYAGSTALQKITIVKDVGGLMRPKGPFAQADADLQKIAGFGT